MSDELELDFDVSEQDSELVLDLLEDDNVPADDPLAALEYTGDLQTDAKAEVEAVVTGFAERAKAENLRRIAATDSEYWVCLCFQSREQVQEFLRATAWGSPDAKYLDGCAIAGKLKVPLPPGAAPRNVKIDKTWSGMAKAL